MAPYPGKIRMAPVRWLGCSVNADAENRAAVPMVQMMIDRIMASLIEAYANLADYPQISGLPRHVSE